MTAMAFKLRPNKDFVQSHYTSKNIHTTFLAKAPKAFKAGTSDNPFSTSFINPSFLSCHQNPKSWQISDIKTLSTLKCT